MSRGNDVDAGRLDVIDKCQEEIAEDSAVRLRAAARSVGAVTEVDAIPEFGGDEFVVVRIMPPRWRRPATAVSPLSVASSVVGRPDWCASYLARVEDGAGLRTRTADPRMPHAAVVHVDGTPHWRSAIYLGPTNCWLVVATGVTPNRRWRSRSPCTRELGGAVQQAHFGRYSRAGWTLWWLRKLNIRRRLEHVGGCAVR